MKLFKSDQLLNLQLNRVLPQGLWKEILLIYSGTNQAGKTVSRSDLGTIRIMRGNQLQHYVTFEVLQRLTDLKYGVAPFTSTTGGAFSAICKVPLKPFDEENSGTYFDGNSGTYIELLYPNLGTIISAGTVKIYLVPAQVSTGYIPSLSMQSIQSGGASVDTEVITGKNIAALYAMYNTNFTQLNVRVDNDLRIDSTFADLQMLSAMNNRVESTSSDGYNLVEIDLNPNKVVSLVNNDKVVFGFTSTTADALIMAKLQYNFSPNEVTLTPIRKIPVQGTADETT